jgi:hypothetical protein
LASDQHGLRLRLTISAKLLASDQHRLRLRLTISAKLLAIGLPSLHRLHLSRPHLLASLHWLDAIRPRLLARLHRLDAIRPRLLTFDLTSLHRLDAIRARLLTFHPGRTLGQACLSPLDRRLTHLLAFSTHLDSLCHRLPLRRREALCALHTRCGHLLDTLRPFDGSDALRAFNPRRLKRLHSGRTLSAASAAATLRPGLHGLAALVPVGPRTGRGRDRQCGDTRGEKYPGHHNFSF